MPISKETHITCDFPGGGGGIWTPYPPSGSALANVVLTRTCTQLYLERTIIYLLGFEHHQLLLLLVYCFMYLPLFVGVLCWYALLYVFSSFAIILTGKRGLVAFLL